MVILLRLENGAIGNVLIGVADLRYEAHNLTVR